MFVGAYWSERKESKEDAATRIARFLVVIGERFEELATWFSKAGTRSAALQSPLVVDRASVAKNLTVNRRDADRQPIPELGFRFSVWNGSTASFSATVGAHNPHVGNAVVLEIDDEVELGRDSYQTLLREIIRVFDPDHAVVTSDEHLAKAGVKKPWESGLFTYERGDEIREHTFP